MAIQFNHTILSARDSQASARFLAEMLGLPAPTHWGPFDVVTTENGANLDYMQVEEKIVPQHYAFLVNEAEFDKIFARVRDRKLSYWADPGQATRGGDQSPRRRPRVLLRRPQRPPARGHHPPLWQRRLESLNGCRVSARVTAP